jgi:ABC-type polysaccharide/polyol phosphate export permease
MTTIKKLLGLVWILLAPTSVVLMFMQAFEKTNAAAEGIARTNTALQWGIILFIFIPISIGFAIFGFHSFKGEYDQLDIEN